MSRRGSARLSRLKFRVDENARYRSSVKSLRGSFLLGNTAILPGGRVVQFSRPPKTSRGGWRSP